MKIEPPENWIEIDCGVVSPISLDGVAAVTTTEIDKDG
jgi:hypothetical protein